MIIPWNWMKMFFNVLISCPKCDSHDMIIKGIVTKNKQNILEKTVEYKKQQYQCKYCNKKFEIKNKTFDIKDDTN